MQQKIYFHYQYKAFPFKHRNKLKAFLNYIFKEEGVKLEKVDYIFCTDKFLLELNQKHLNHNTYTDIITFPLSAKGAPVISEVYISIDRINENSSLLKTTFSQELHRVIFHGALHLCGYTDKTKNEKQLMRSKEDYYLSRYFVPRETL